MSIAPPEPLFDARLVRRRLQRVLDAGGFCDLLLSIAAQELAERLQAVLRPLPLTAVFAPPAPAALAPLRRCDGIETLVLATAASPRDAGKCVVQADLEQVPFGVASLDCAIVLSGLETANDPAGALIQLRRALKPDGLLLAAMLGGDSLAELRQAWLSAESEVRGEVTPRIAPFADIRDLGGLLQRAGFALPVTDTDRLTVRYPSALAAMRELKAMGLSNALTQRSRSPVTKRLLAAAAAAYEDRFADADGRIPATLQMIYLTAWVPHESQPRPLRPGSAQARLADALATTEHKVKR